VTWDKGFDFRATSGFVADPADCAYVLSSDTTSTVRNGATFIWTGNIAQLDSRDRTTSGDTRLSGMNFMAAGNAAAVWDLTLPATGAYDVYLAAGDQASQQIIKLTVGDSGTPFITINDVDTLAADQYLDATGALRTRAQWLADSARGGTKVTRTFATTILRLTIGDGIIGLASCIAHLFVSQVATGVATAIYGDNFMTFSQFERLA
jgi:hypothetical protein